MGDGKRRLPVLQPKEEEGEDRPPWHWSVIGGFGTMLVFLPLSGASAWFARRTYARYLHGSTPEQLLQAAEALTARQRTWLGVLSVAGPMLSLALASVAGGTLVGRFGGAAGKREAAVAAVLAAAVSSAVAARELVDRPDGPVLWVFTSTILFVVAGVTGWLGGALGLRLRR